MHFTPIAPYDSRGNLDERLLTKSEETCMKSSELSGGHTVEVINAIKEMLLTVNSYYSNKIESEGTHPLDIERAAKKEFSSDSQEKKLQLLSLAYIKTQKEIELCLSEYRYPSPYSKDFILWVHEKLYSCEGMDAFLTIPFKDEVITMIPGKLREHRVEVGRHIAPEHTGLDSLMAQYEKLYNGSLNNRLSSQLIYALSSHHRLTWIHPFLDGNGRTSRLVLDGALFYMNLPGYGLWNISRGLARQSDNYKKFLSKADMDRQGDFDGRGPLSTYELAEYVEFMLDCALDQINYMGRYLKLNELSLRLDKYVARSQDNLLDIPPLPKYSNIIFKHLLLHGEAPRGSIGGIVGVSERSARTIISKLIEGGYIVSDSPKGSIKLRFNAHISSYLFPELVPEKQ